ncbi:MAG: hypothetical protein WCT45_01490 [Candidatus Paceibacterota bacterium]|jgi:hypothetical protein
MSENVPKPISAERTIELQALRELDRVELTRRAEEGKAAREGREEIAALTAELNEGGTPEKSADEWREELRAAIEGDKKKRKIQVITLAMELRASSEQFPFTGIVAEEYDKMRATEEECPGYTTPVVELVKRFEHEGMKVVLGKNPMSGNVHILPAQSTNIEMDSISPKQLRLSDRMHEKLKELILLCRG